MNITEQAKQAAQAIQYIFPAHDDVQRRLDQVAQRIQSAIDSATAELRAENARLTSRIAELEGALQELLNECDKSFLAHSLISTPTEPLVVARAALNQTKPTP